MGLLKDGWETAGRTGDFRGRSTRTDLFSYWLLTFLAGAALLLLTTLIETALPPGARLSEIALLGLQTLLLVPLAALCARRLHDRGWSGWWLLVSVPALILAGFKTYYRLIGDIDALLAHDRSPANLAAFLLVVPVLVLLFLPGEEGANRYGPNPRNEPTGEPA
jgi:uncharacterized membrane protein YhaH (DUF805 family)